MSANSAQLNEKIEQYIKSLFSSSLTLLESIIVEAPALGFPPIAIAKEQAAFLQVIVRSTSAMNILEIGSLAGYSAFAMALALNSGGKLTTVDTEQKSVDYITRKASEYGMQNIINAVRSTGRQFVDNLKENEVFDLIFIDADKTSYLYYYEKLLPHLKTGGLIIADNAFAFGFILDSEGAPQDDLDNIAAMRVFNSNIANDTRVSATMVPLGDGMLMAVKL